MLLYRRGESEAALHHFQEALPLMQAADFRRGHAVVLNNMGLAQEALGNKLQAADTYRSLLPVVQALGDSLLEAAIHNNLGTIFHDIGETEEALAHHQRALSIWRNAKETAYQAV